MQLHNLLPNIMIVVQLLAFFPLAYSGRWGTGVYWLLAGFICFTAHYLIPRFG